MSCSLVCFLAVTTVIYQIPDREDLPDQHRGERGECEEEQI